MKFHPIVARSVDRQHNHAHFNRSMEFKREKNDEIMFKSEKLSLNFEKRFWLEFLVKFLRRNNFFLVAF